MTAPLDIAALRGLLERATAGPWIPCEHLKSAEADAACPCGYRGVIFGPPDADCGADDRAICQPGHEPAPPGQEGTEPGRFPRAQEIANMQLIAAMRNSLPALLARVAELEGALRTMTEHYVFMVSINDKPWNPETEVEVIAARATLTKEPTVERTAK